MTAATSADGVATTETTAEQFEGFDAEFGTDPDEVSVELRAGSPGYVRLREGDYLQEGDAFYRDELGMDNPTLDTWRVTSITPETVVGEHVDTGDERTWDRADVEQGLAMGTYSTNLTDFERVSVYQAGRWSEYDPESDDDGTTYTGRPYVAVVAYGDNGQKYGRRYRFREAESDELELAEQDRPRGGFDDEVAERLDERVRAALEAEGYAVRERED